MMRRLSFIFSALGVLVLAACGANGAALQVSDPWVRAAVVTGAAMPAMDATAHGDAAATDGTMDHSADAPAMNMALGSTSAAYMVLRSRSGDTLLGVATDAAEVAELHTVERDGDIMRMRPVPQIEVAAGGTTTLEPGGMHVMLIGLRRELQAGETVRLTLTFANAGEIVVDAPVRAP